MKLFVNVLHWVLIIFLGQEMAPFFTNELVVPSKKLGTQNIKQYKM